MEADGTMCDVVDEAVGHLLDHYDPKKNAMFARDFVLVLSSSFFGHHKQTGTPVASGEFFMRGDLHLMSHVMATHMTEHKEFAAVMFHAVEVYCRQQCEDQLSDRK
jgi:Zn-dependent membrane protease YugP